MTLSSLVFILVALIFTGLWYCLQQRDVSVSPAVITAVVPWFAIVGVGVAVVRSTRSVGSSGPSLWSLTIYLSTGALITALWLVFDGLGVENRPRWTAVFGVVAAGVVGGLSLLTVGEFSTRVLFWNSVAVVLAVGVAALVTQFVFAHNRHDQRWLGAAVLFAHVLDATTTAVGLERLGMSEQNPISASIIHIGDSVGVPGVGLFLLIKTAVAVAVVSLLTDDTVGPRLDTTAFLVIATGAGLVPAVHNLFAFVFSVR
ncbi:DUF63 family protein (plasmid) [Haloferax larsenii]|uniref:DUF63 family protein n=1 Tax=Haloferax larsenii TaxID=302484 RepID=A0ABY5RJF1_HALLR|nr:DUF63 family protein [Haloferax larsenii]UVE52033.1 DUF63 family protein [Haloferax larsenii]